MKPARLTVIRLMSLVLLFSGPITAFGLISPKEAQVKYDAANTRIEGGDIDVDWRELRLDAVVAGVDGSFDWRKANAEGVAAFNKGDYSKSLAKGQEIVKHNVANGDGHFLTMVSYKHLGQQADADHEKAIVDKIVQSIVGSGDGKAAETAWFVVSTSEEYFILRLMGLQPKSQALVQQKDHAFDKMTVVGDGNTEQTLWFNTDTDMKMMEQALQK
jgi:hypothetical protein